MSERNKPCWSTLPDGPCEHAAALLPRHAQLACRLVCRTWRTSFTHALSPLTVDTRSFRNQAGPSSADTLSERQPDDVPCPLGHGWVAFTRAVASLLRSITVRVSLYHESKARAALCTASCTACLRYLASLPHFTQDRLQLILPLRYALPDAVTDLLSRDLCRLRSLRLVRCSLTQQLAAVLAGLPALRHLCIAHANLAALPQLLAAATHLEHLHVHGYHSLVIKEDNPHQLACWREAAALVHRSCQERRDVQGQGQAQRREQQGEVQTSPARHLPSSSSVLGGSSGGVGAAGRLRCLAVSAHHQYHDTVLDETEHGFEAEALRWQIRYDSSSGDEIQFRNEAAGPSGGVLGGPTISSQASGGWGHTGGSGHAPGRGGGEETEGDGGAQGDGCWPDPRQDPVGPRGCAGGGSGGRGTYMGLGSGGDALCAAALVGVRCNCCGTAVDPSDEHWHDTRRMPTGAGWLAPAWPSPLASPARTAAAARTPGPEGAGDDGSLELRGPNTASPAGRLGGAAGEAAIGEARYPALSDGAAAAGAVSGSPPRGLHLSKSGKREVSVYPPVVLLQEVQQPHWRHLQYVQLALVRRPRQPAPQQQPQPGPEPQQPQPRPPPPPPPPLPLLLLQGQEDLGAAGSAGSGATHQRGGDQAGGDGDPGSAFASTVPAAAAAEATLEPLNALEDLTGVWLDPEEWDEEEELPQAPPSARNPAAPTGSSPAIPQPASVMPQHPQAHGASARWGLVDDVWVRLHDPPTQEAAHGPVQDAVTHAALLTSCTRLRSLALGDRRRPFLGIGDDTVALLARLAGLTRLYLSAAYPLPLGGGDSASGAADASAAAPAAAAAAGAASAGSSAATELHSVGREEQQRVQLPAPLAPPRLTPLGGLTALQRLGLHFKNPMGHPAVVSQAAVPPSLTSLSLYGVVLVPCCTTAKAPEPSVMTRPLAADVAAAPAPAVARNAGGGVGVGPLESLRELFLTSSYIVRADLLGCSRRLTVLSLLDSGLGVGGGDRETAESGHPAERERPAERGVAVAAAPMAGASVAAAPATEEDDGTALPLARLLRRWYHVQTLWVVGSPATSTATRLPAEIGVDWYSPGALQAIARCLPSLQMLQLSPPEAACMRATWRTPSATVPIIATATTTTATTTTRQTGNKGANKGCHDPAHILPLAAGPSTSSQGCGPATLVVAPGSSGGESRSQETGSFANFLPHWNLARLSAGAGGSASAGSGNVGTTPFGARGAHTDIPRGGTGTEAVSPADTEASAAGASATRNCTAIGPANERSEPPERPLGHDGDSGNWLTTLLDLLCHHATHLKCLRVACVVADKASGERAVAAARTWLPSGLPYLDKLSVVLDLALPYALAQPQPEACVQEWAKCLKGAEEGLQGQMRYTCVSLSASPGAVSRVRTAARALAHRT